MMLFSNMMCPALYNDFASVTNGLFENKDDYNPYALIIVSKNVDELLIFSSEFDVGLEGTEYFSKWSKRHPTVFEASGRISFQFEPYVTSYKISDPTKFIEEENVLKDIFKLPNKTYRERMQIMSGSIYLLLYEDNAIAGRPLQTFMQTILESVRGKWYLYFKDELANSKFPPIVDSNDIIEQLDEFSEIAPFFKTVTKISSLFYEKSRSKGRIAVLKNKSNG